tara:strand:+ start:954 stop:3284 length:2331 start_codon:yes stop_codon:yes gene_type:complete
MSSKSDNHDKSNTPKNKKKKGKGDDDKGDDKIDNEQFQEMLANMFPSKHQSQKVKAIKDKKKSKGKKGKNHKKGKKVKKEDSDDEDYNPEEDVQSTDDSELDRQFEEEYANELLDEIEQEEEDSEEEDSYDEYDEDYDDEDEMYRDMQKGFQGMKFNIIFTDPGNRREEWDEEDDVMDEEEFLEALEEEEEEFEEEEDKPPKKSKSRSKPKDNVKMSKKEYELHRREERKCKKMEPKFKVKERIFIKLDDWDKKYKGTVKKIHNNKSGKHKYDVKLDESDDEGEYEIVRKVPENKMKKLKEDSNQSEDYNDLLSEMKELLAAKKKGGKAFEKKFEQMQKVAEEQEKKARAKEVKSKKEKNFKKFRKLLRGKRAMTDIKYFKSLDIEAQENIMKKLKEVQEYSNEEKPHKFKLIESNIPVQYKTLAMRKLDSLKWMDPGSGEYYKIKQWVDNFMKIPFGEYSTLPVCLEDGEDKCREFMESAKEKLDEAVYGLEDAKMQIMQLVGQWISNPNSMGKALAIKGPMGTGKTTLVKEGISKILNRPFSFIALGGATDSSFLEGHSYTYEGSIWGRIVDTLINCGSMNPVFYFDELDKVSQTPKGEEIIGILTHLTDTSQNSNYHDKYFSNIDFDLSKALFIFSYNDESKVNPILRDRMYRISTKGYEKDQKDIIAQQYLIPKIIKEVNFKKDEIIIPRETIDYICEHLVESEKGVRNLKRALEIIYTKINLYRLIPKDSKLFNNEKPIEIKLPFTVTPDIVKDLVKKSDSHNPIPFGMFI